MVSIPLDNVVVSVGLWWVVYTADYYLTIYGRQLWMQHSQPYFKLGGSYELNPYYQKDIDAGRLVSRRFIFVLAFGTVLMLLIYGSVQYLGAPQLFGLAVGVLVLPEMVVLSTHVQNIHLFKTAATPNAVQGEIAYARWLSLEATAWRYGYWAVVFLIFGFLTAQWVFIGGAVGCLSVFIRFRRHSSRTRLQTKPVPAAPPQP